MKEMDSILKTKFFIVISLLVIFLSACSEGTATTDDSAESTTKAEMITAI
ncbi:hypothetical protein [Planococcus sp. S3-L1]|nr:hypothetical protein [Planococcus sp. S3-L1]MDJ0333356.1 hypothetical protein [Planococcus sp. S3-L1]